MTEHHTPPADSPATLRADADDLEAQAARFRAAADRLDAAEAAHRPTGSADGGPQNMFAPAGQLERYHLQHMTPAEIDQARKDGRLDHLLGRTR